MSILENIKKVEEEIAASCACYGRNAGSVRLMAVSKFQPKEAVKEAVEAGLTLFGESRMQECACKFEERKTCFPNVELHFIGALQRNKAKKAALFADCVQSVDGERLVEALGTAALGRETPLSILFELNSGEESKSGMRSETELFNAVEAALKFPSLKISGLMTMAPFVNDEKKIRGAFCALRENAVKLAARYPKTDFSTLSMGMSGDFKWAIAEGSTLLRIGTAIFGERA
ncbi:MAG: YggS family pyridoxal phosphate-dependent enzyme [Spirochaetaceae bacterium]|jgi:pyridoxal phosphate enzyme (YggS family)|nr:YggS family pyridoxal phosphate-dependent enzyme [Spirochaetaceae bacterium]